MTSTKKPSWRDHLEVHPAADQFPMMPPDEMKALGEDIKAQGLTHPIVFWSPGKRHAKAPEIFLLDGRNRLDAMATAGLDVWKEIGCSVLGKGKIDLGHNGFAMARSRFNIYMNSGATARRCIRALTLSRMSFRLTLGAGT